MKTTEQIVALIDNQIDILNLDIAYDRIYNDESYKLGLHARKYLEQLKEAILNG